MRSTVIFLNICGYYTRWKSINYYFRPNSIPCYFPK